VQSLFTELELEEARATHLPLCGPCGLWEQCRSPKMKPTGEGKRGILVVGEAPGEHEDAQGKPFVGTSGRTLDRMFKKAGVNLRRDCWITNTLICRPPGNATPTDKQIDYCKPNLLNTIKELNPKTIVLVGSAAVRSLIGHIWKKKPGPITEWVGWSIPDREFNAWICPVYHPAYLFRQHRRALDAIAGEQLKSALRHTGRPWRKIPDYTGQVECITDPRRAAACIREIRLKGGRAAWDLETNMLKPDGDSARILSASICWEGKKTISFLWSDEVVEPFKKFLLSQSQKIGHNMKFDHRWVMKIIDTRTRNWYWDTMIMAHVLDPRQGITSLNFQSYVNLGLPPYDSHVDAYKRSPTPRTPNKLDQCPVEDLLLYGGIDALVTYKLFEKQHKQLMKMDEKIRKGLLKAYHLFHEGIQALADMEQEGVRVDEEVLEESAKQVKASIAKNKESLTKTETYKVWEREYGIKMNLSSRAQLGKVLFDHMGLPMPATTKTGRPKTDKETLRQVGGDFINLYLGTAQLEKSFSTYLQGLRKSVVDGFVHPVYNLHLVRTYRSSCSNPNFQNVPVRDKVMSKMIRESYVPRPGHLFIEADFSALEWCIASCFWKDKKMLADASSNELDIHRDMAARCYQIDVNDVDGMMRFVAKGGFTFAYLYGSDWMNISKNMWEAIAENDLRVNGRSMYEHLASRGITELGNQLREDGPTPGTFESHIFDTQQWFDGHFHDLYSRKLQWVKSYDQRGWFPLLTGFVCRGDYTRNQLFNLPVQGPAFHILLWALVRLTKELRRNGMRSVVVGEVHDSILVDAVKSEVQDVLNMMLKIMTVDVSKAMPWLTVPLAIGVDVAEDNWHSKKPWAKTDGKWGSE